MDPVAGGGFDGRYRAWRRRWWPPCGRLRNRSGPEVGRLVARIRRTLVEPRDALRAFADDLDDATGDLVAAYLILGARRRGAGLASVLQGLAESVAADARALRGGGGGSG